MEHGIDLARKNGNEPWAGIFQVMLAWLHMLACDFSGARAMGEALLAKHTQVPMGQTQSIAWITVAYSDLATGDPQRALQAFTKVRDRPLKPKVFMQWYWRMIAEFGIVSSHLELGNLDAAETGAEIFAEEMAALADPAMRSRAWSTLALVAAAKRNLPRALQCADRAVEEMRGFDLPWVAWRVHGTASWLYALAAQPQAAANHGHTAEVALLHLVNSFDPGDPLRETLRQGMENLKARSWGKLGRSPVAGDAGQ